jgi:hypothetical protein
VWIFQALAILMPYPWIAFVVAAGLAALAAASRRRVAGGAAAAWALYGLYEYGMKLRVLCTGECNIRVDLLLAYPLLLAISLWAVISGIAAMRKGTRSRSIENADTDPPRRIPR